MGASTLTIGTDTDSGIRISRGGAAAAVSIQDLTISFSDKAQQRYNSGAGIFAFGGNGTTQTLRNINIDNVEVVNAGVGIQLNSGVVESRVTNCYVRETIADGIAVYSFSGPCRDILISNNRLFNTGDDSIANNSYSNNPDVNRSVIITNNIIDNSGAAGIASWGSDGCIIVNNIIRNTYIMAIKAQAGDGFNSVSNLSIIGNQVYGAGQGYAGGLPSYVPSRGPIAGISIVKVNTGVTVSNVTISNNTVGPSVSGACYGQGIMLWDYALASNTFSNIKIDNNTLIGPFSALPGGYRTNPTGMTTTDGIMINSFNNASITNNYVFRARENGIATGTLTSGTLTVKDNTVDTPNTTATANTFGYLLQGNATPIFKDNACINFSTLAGIVNSTTTLYTLVTSSATGLRYTLRPTDNTVIICLSSPANNTFIVPTTITVPDFRVTIQQLGTGSITVSAAPGVVLNSAGNKFRLNEQYATADLSYINSAIGWTLYGNLST
jgi:parallel beta-helix repeat protein